MIHWSLVYRAAGIQGSWVKFSLFSGHSFPLFVVLRSCSFVFDCSSFQINDFACHKFKSMLLFIPSYFFCGVVFCSPCSLSNYTSNTESRSLITLSTSLNNVFTTSIQLSELVFKIILYTCKRKCKYPDIYNVVVLVVRW